MGIEEMEKTDSSMLGGGGFFAPVAGQFRIFQRSMLWRSLLWRSLLRRAGSKRKTLAVRETAALGDRRCISVIQFERQRFLIGYTPSAITLLAQLPDESGGGNDRDAGMEVGEKN
jgi:hypothetical protein